jgi:hypothetical protein
LIRHLYVRKKEEILWDLTFLLGSLLIQEMSMKKRLVQQITNSKLCKVLVHGGNLGKYFKPSPPCTPIHLDELFLKEEKGGFI